MVATPPIFDREILDEIVAQIGEAATQAVLGLFIAESRELIAAMRDGIAGERDAARRAAHSLKSSAGQIGAAALSEAAWLVEAAVGQKGANLADLLAALERCAGETEAALAPLLHG